MHIRTHLQDVSVSRTMQIVHIYILTASLYSREYLIPVQHYVCELMLSNHKHDDSYRDTSQPCGAAVHTKINISDTTTGLWERLCVM